jgi:hypothetical protein
MSALRLATIFACFLVPGVLVTAHFRDRAFADAPRTDAYEAFATDVAAMEYTLAGWFIATIMAGAVTIAVLCFCAWRENVSLRRDNKIAS